MKELILPRDGLEMADMVKKANSARTPLEIIGEGSKRQLGRPMKTGAILSTRQISGISYYNPRDKIICVRAGTSLSMVEHSLRHENQQLAFEPIDYGHMLGGNAGHGSIGGAIACNLSGPRRITDGSARDWLLGVQAVNGHGELFNVGARAGRGNAGYGIMRALAGSWGTLAIITELTLRTAPRPEITSTLVLFGLEDRLAVRALCEAMAGKWRVTGAIHLQQEATCLLGDKALAGEKKTLTAIRVEGFARQVAVAASGLRSLLSCYGDVISLDEERGASLWRDIRQIQFISHSPRPVWKISTAPRNGPLLVSELGHIVDVRASYDWAGGLIWLEVPQSSDVSASDIRRSLAHLGGHATLIRADREARAKTEVFQPMPEAMGELTRGLKNAFDPKHILNPGRIYPESRDL